MSPDAATSVFSGVTRASLPRRAITSRAGSTPSAGAPPSRYTRACRASRARYVATWSPSAPCANCALRLRERRRSARHPPRRPAVGRRVTRRHVERHRRRLGRAEVDQDLPGRARRTHPHTAEVSLPQDLAVRRAAELVRPRRVAEVAGRRHVHHLGRPRELPGPRRPAGVELDAVDRARVEHHRLRVQMRKERLTDRGPDRVGSKRALGIDQRLPGARRLGRQGDRQDGQQPGNEQQAAAAHAREYASGATPVPGAFICAGGR